MGFQTEVRKSQLGVAVVVVVVVVGAPAVVPCTAGPTKCPT